MRGSPKTTPLAEVDLDTWATVIDTDLTGMVRCGQAVLPRLLERDAGG